MQFARRRRGPRAVVVSARVAALCGCGRCVGGATGRQSRGAPARSGRERPAPARATASQPSQSVRANRSRTRLSMARPHARAISPPSALEEQARPQPAAARLGRRRRPAPCGRRTDRDRRPVTARGRSTAGLRRRDSRFNSSSGKAAGRRRSGFFMPGGLRSGIQAPGRAGCAAATGSGPRRCVPASAAGSGRNERRVRSAGLVGQAQKRFRIVGQVAGKHRRFRSSPSKVRPSTVSPAIGVPTIDGQGVRRPRVTVPSRVARTEASASDLDVRAGELARGSTARATMRAEDRLEPVVIS